MTEAHQIETATGLATENNSCRLSRILVDCTETYLSGCNSGIQRVVRSIVERSSIISLHAGIPCIPVIALGKCFYPLASFPVLLKGDHLNRRVLDAGKSLYHFIDGLMKRPVFMKDHQGEENDRFWEDLKMSSFSPRATVKRIGRNVLMGALNLPLRIRAGKAIIPGRRDLLLMPDIFWGGSDPLEAARSFHEKGGMVIPVIHDLIPLRYPQFCHEGTAREFQRTLPEIVELAGGLLTDSRSVRKEVEDYLSSTFPKKRIPVMHFYLGAEMFGRHSSTLPVRKELQKFALEGSFFLMVGAIQPHKGQLIVLEAFERMWKEGFSGKLIILGRVGGKGDEVMRRLRSSGFFGKMLFVYHDANDTELDLLYRNARALIMASFAEGFGLPLVEAMNLGVPVIASDLPVFREIGGSYPDYFSVGSSEDLLRVIGEKNTMCIKRAGESIQKWIDWDQAVGYLAENILCLCRDKNVHV